MKDRKRLKDVTLICIDTKNYGQAIHALQKSLDHIEPARCLFLTDIDFTTEGIETVKVPKINSKREYSEFVIKELYKYFDTSHCLLIQWDGYVLDGSVWTDKFLESDYIGASWIYDSDRTVGNGGFSLRSHKLCKILGEDDFIDVLHPEDQSICIIYKFYLEEKYGIKFASEELADKFAFETKTPANRTFGFHNFFHKPYQETIMFTRKGAMGDVIAIEPLMHYYHKKGFRVVLNTLPQFYNLFIQHYFKVYHPSELDGRIKHREIKLDMGYEMKPKQLHLKSYYEIASVPEEEMELVKPRLNLNFDPQQNKLFPKYAVIHYDKRAQNGRNIQGINWSDIVSHLNKLGYFVIQIGMGEGELIKGAIRMSTPTEPFLMWVIGGADLFIGADSGPSNIAVAMDVPSVIFFGSVASEYIHPDIKNIEVIESMLECPVPKCWHEVVGCEGQKCVVDESTPPCVQFDTYEVINSINKLIK